MGVMLPKNLTYDKWKKLPEKKQIELCQDLNSYGNEHNEIFNGVETEFIKTYQAQSGIEKASCGRAPCLGPLNCITVTIKRGQKRTELPKYFMGFYIYKTYQKRT